MSEEILEKRVEILCTEVFGSLNCISDDSPASGMSVKQRCCDYSQIKSIILFLILLQGLIILMEKLTI
jgi:hypothetical protein